MPEIENLFLEIFMHLSLQLPLLHNKQKRHSFPGPDYTKSVNAIVYRGECSTYHYIHINKMPLIVKYRLHENNKNNICLYDRHEHIL